MSFFTYFVRLLTYQDKKKAGKKHYSLSELWKIDKLPCKKKELRLKNDNNLNEIFVARFLFRELWLFFAYKMLYLSVLVH